MRKFSVIALFLSVGLMLGCSVKEERDGCPCRLFLDLTSVDVADQSPFLISIFSADGFEYRKVVDVKNFQDTCVVDVPRTELDVIVWSGGGEYMYTDGLTIPPGSECPPVFIHTGRLEAKGEAVYENILLKKNYCILNLTFAAPHTARYIALRGSVAGFDKYGQPVRGEFSVHREADSISSGIFYIPRLYDTPLYLDVEEADGIMRTFPLHDYLSDYGYDREVDELNDLNMTLAYTPLGINFIIQGWGEEKVINVVI
ncbi:MAG: hypothetical protein IKV75_06635 [Bacteroidales bacterium]|nr:hypothetical protein [Bacteroidales bacterium]